MSSNRFVIVAIFCLVHDLQIALTLFGSKKILHHAGKTEKHRAQCELRCVRLAHMLFVDVERALMCALKIIIDSATSYNHL